MGHGYNRGGYIRICNLRLRLGFCYRYGSNVFSFAACNKVNRFAGLWNNRRNNIGHGILSDFNWFCYVRSNNRRHGRHIGLVSIRRIVFVDKVNDILTLCSWVFSHQNAAAFRNGTAAQAIEAFKFGYAHAGIVSNGIKFFVAQRGINIPRHQGIWIGIAVVFLKCRNRRNWQQQTTVVFRDKYWGIETWVECQQFAFADVCKASDCAVINRFVDADRFEIRLIADFADIHAESLRVGNDVADGQKFWNVVACFIRHT